VRYLTWQLNWSDPAYGTGPEWDIGQRGGHAEASAFVADPTILGYLTVGCDLAGLNDWSVTELSAADALAFADAIVPGCSFNADGYIVTPAPEE
jgi:hypothetical protein